MKAFNFAYSSENFMYPEDMRLLVSGLGELGTINVSEKRLEELYEKYSDEVWCAGWMEVNDEMIKSFAYWLAEEDI